MDPVLLVMCTYRLTASRLDYFNFIFFDIFFRALKNSIQEEDADICLIVKDLQRGRKRDHEPTKEFYTDLLEKNGITRVTRVLPITELLLEHKTFEAKHKLAKSYDLFLVDGAVSHRVGKFAGKIFAKCKKNPIPVKNITEENTKLKETIERAINHINFKLSNHGNLISIDVASTKMTERQISHNVLDIIEQLKTVLPGGWANVRQILLRNNQHTKISVPIYVNLTNSNHVPVPEVVSQVTEKVKKANSMLDTKKSKFVVTTNAQLMRKSVMKEAEAATIANPPKQKKKNKLNKVKGGKVEKKEKPAKLSKKVDNTVSATTTTAVAEAAPKVEKVKAKKVKQAIKVQAEKVVEKVVKPKSKGLKQPPTKKNAKKV